MAQVLTAKQAGFVQRYSGAVQQLLGIVDALTLLNAEFANNAYGTGGANAIPDAIVQGGTLQYGRSRDRDRAQHCCVRS